jgi:hypothetical protein
MSGAERRLHRGTTEGSSPAARGSPLSSTLSIQDELNMQKPWKIRSAGGFGDITWLPRTLHKVSVSQKTHENSYFLISNDG